MSILRRSLELGLGALAVTREHAEAWLDELAQREEVPAGAERDRLIDDLMERGRQFGEELSEAVRKEVAAALARSGLVRREEYETLLARVAELERRVAGAPAIEPVADL